MIRLFGSETCQKCIALEKALKMLDIEFIFINAMADDTQSFCDEQNVDALPHIQLLDEDNQVVWQMSERVVLDDVLLQLRNQIL